MLTLLLATALATSGVYTFHSRDPITNTLCLTDGDPGGVFQGGVPKNRCSELTFSTYANDAFTSGIEGGDKAVLIDLGDSLAYSKAHALPITVGGDATFSSIALVNGSLVLRVSGREPQVLPEATALQATPRGAASALAALGHVYLLRLVRSSSSERLFKFFVIAHTPGQVVTIRWERLN